MKAAFIFAPFICLLFRPLHIGGTPFSFLYYLCSINGWPFARPSLLFFSLQARFGEAATAAQRQALEISELSVQLRQALEDETEARAAAEARALVAEENVRDLERTLQARVQAAEAAGEAQRRRESADGAVGSAALCAISQNLDLLQSECSQLIIESGIAQPDHTRNNIGNGGRSAAREGSAFSAHELVTETPDLRGSGSGNEQHQRQHKHHDQTTKSFVSMFDMSTMAASDSPLRLSKAPPDWRSPRFGDGDVCGSARENFMILEQREQKNAVEVAAMTARAASEHNSAALRQLFNSPRMSEANQQEAPSVAESKLSTPRLRVLNKGNDNGVTAVAAAQEVRLLDQSTTMLDNGSISAITTAHATMKVNGMPSSSSSCSLPHRPSSSAISMRGLSDNDLQLTLPRYEPLMETSSRPSASAAGIGVGPALVSTFQRGVWISRYGGPGPSQHGRSDRKSVV